MRDLSRAYDVMFGLRELDRLGQRSADARDCVITAEHEFLTKCGWVWNDKDRWSHPDLPGGDMEAWQAIRRVSEALMLLSTEEKPKAAEEVQS